MDWLSFDSLLLLGASSSAAWLAFLFTAVKVVLGVGFVIFVHELGHFLAAKACGVKCEKFYVGFDVPIQIGPLKLPRALCRFQWGETEYGIGVVPLGGYVKMLGQDDNPTKAAEESQRVRVAGVDASGEETIHLDPRSFPAKSVWQRMVIISAGVLMNLFFAVILGAVAYRVGVSYLPCDVASVRPGEPAWEAGLLPGDKIIRLGKTGENDEHLRFTWELRQEVAKLGLGREQADIAPLPVRVRRGQQELDFAVTPSVRLQEIFGSASIGILAPSSNRLDQDAPIAKSLGASRAEPPLLGGDLITKFNGQPLDASQANEQGESTSAEMDRLLALHASEPVTLTVLREEGGAAKELDVILPATPLKTFGMSLSMGPIVSIRLDSPAEKSGVRVGDVMVSINDLPVGDPLTLAARVAQMPGEIVLRVQRKSGDQTEELAIAVKRDSAMYVPELRQQGMRESLQGIGLAYELSQVVAAVETSGPAQKAGVQVGDIVKTGQFLAEGESIHEEAVKAFGEKYNEILTIDPSVHTWSWFMLTAQHMLPEMEAQLTLARDGKEIKARLAPVVDPAQFNPDRGLRVAPFHRVQRAANWSEAIALGGRETVEKVIEVATALWYLIRGRMSVKTLGGPILIAKIAGGEAAASTPRLLIFLTLLSANLAILNFLPIPALDGGHMTFLLIELVRGKPVNERWQQTLTAIGVLCLLGLMVVVVFNDILRL